MSLAPVDALISAGPMPLAQLARRARNAKTGAAVLQNAAHYLGEAGARLGAAYWLGRALAQHGSPTDSMQPHLTALFDRGATFGAWVGLLRESAAAVGGNALSTLSKPLGNIVPLEALAAALTEEQAAFGDDGPAIVAALNKGIRKGILGFFDFLVMFRNKVYGHGAMLAEAVCQRLALPCLAAVAHVLKQPPLVEGGWLGRTAVDLLRPESPRYWKKLQGISETEVDDQAGPSAVDVPSQSLQIVGPAGPISLSFLVVQDEDATGLSRFGFFQRLVTAGRRLSADKVKSVEYLDYLGGPFRDDTRTQEVSSVLSTLPIRTAESSADDPLPKHSSQERRFGDFVVDAELGRGSMGIVYRANQISLGRKVALKVLPPGLLDDAVALGRFHREVQALGRCDHPNVVRVVTSGIEQGRPFFAMELVEGADLSMIFDTLTAWHGRQGGLKAGHLSAASSSARKRARHSEPDAALADAPRESPVPPPSLDDEGDLFERLALLFAGAADGVEEVHRRGLVHRDIKPANLVLTADGERLVVMDLGLAKVTDASAAYTTAGGGDFVGSARYAAPEQIQARLLKIDHRADVYSLGATLYELVTLHTIYPGEDIAALLQKKLTEDPRPARELNPRIPKDLDTILQKAMARRPDDRYSSAAALASDLRAFAEGHPIDARPPSPFDYLRLFYRRQKRLVQLGIGASLLLLSVLVIGIVLVSRERTQAIIERDRAEELATFVADDLYERLRPLGKLKLLSDVTDRIVAHYATRALNEPQAVARYGHAIVRAGRVRDQQGQLKEAREAFDKACALLEGYQEKAGRDARVEVVLAIALDARSRVSIRQNRLEAAGDDSERALGIRTRLAEREPANREYRRDMADSYHRGGDIHKRQGRIDQALTAYQHAVDLYQALMEQDPQDQRAPRDLAEALCAVGRTLRTQGKLDEALVQIQRAQKLCNDLVERDPTDTAAQSALADTHDAVAQIFVQQDNAVVALSEHQKALELRERLVRVEPGSANWQNSLSVSYHYIAHLLQRANEIDEALSYYQKDLEITRRLSEQDPSNTEFQHDLSVSLSNIAQVQRVKGNFQDALSQLREVLAIRSRIAQQDPSNILWQREVAVTEQNIGDVLIDLKQHDDALASMRRGLELTSRLAKDHPGNAEAEHDLALSLAGLARAQEASGHLDEALASFDQAHPVVEKLSTLDPHNAQWQETFAQITFDRGRLLEAAERAKDAEAAYHKVIQVIATLRKKPESGQDAKDLDALRDTAKQAITQPDLSLQSLRPPAPAPIAGPAEAQLSSVRVPRTKVQPGKSQMVDKRPEPLKHDSEAYE